MYPHDKVSLNERFKKYEYLTNYLLMHFFNLKEIKTNWKYALKKYSIIEKYFYLFILFNIYFCIRITI